MKILKIISNFPGLAETEYPDTKIIQRDYPTGNSKLIRILKIYIDSFRFDYIVFNMLHSDAYGLCLLKYLVPFSKCKLIVVDLILPIPATPQEKLKTFFRFILLRKVYRFFHYSKNTAGFKKYYHLHERKFIYIPFKTNNIESIKKITPHDEGYIFVGGQTRRDFKTLFEAIQDLPYPVRIVSPDSQILEKHGSAMNYVNLPNNVTLITNARTPDTFTREIAGARLAVLPIVKNNISPSGIGVYLQCMALKKCVIISSGPSVDDILTDKYQALIVPPEDPKTLRDAIVLAYEDEHLRNEVAMHGYNYAFSLGDELRLNYSIIEKLHNDNLSKGYNK